jgi:hypothetical protein
MSATRLGSLRDSTAGEIKTSLAYSASIGVRLCGWHVLDSERIVANDFRFRGLQVESRNLMLGWGDMSARFHLIRVLQQAPAIDDR